MFSLTQHSTYHLDSPLTQAMYTVKRFKAQNKQLTAVNSDQAIRIQTLTREGSQLLSENVALRQEVIHLRMELQRRDKQSEILENNKRIVKLLEDKLEDVRLLTKQLNQPPAVSSPEKDDDEMPYLESRLMRSSYTPGEYREPIMPSIEEEEALSRRTSLASERRRSSYNFAYIDLPPPAPAPAPAPELDELEPVEDPLPPMFNVESRRRRRDSQLLGRSGALTEPVPSPAKAASTPVSASKPPKRKLAERDSESTSLSEEPDDIDFRFTKLSERTSKREPRDTEDVRPSGGSKFIREDVLVDRTTPEADPVLVAEEKQERPPIALKGLKGRRLPTDGAIPTLSARKALGPKSTNSDTVNSPIKIASHNDQKEDDYPVKEKISEKLPSVTARTYRSSALRDKDTPPPESDPSTAITTATGRAARRNRPAVSYAEPKLNSKMRREENGLMDAVTGEGKVRRASFVKKKTSKEDIVVKTEEEEEEKPLSSRPRVHFDKPIEQGPRERIKKARSASGEIIDEPDRARIKKSRTENEDTDQPQSAFLSSRKRRTSALITPFAGLDDDQSPPEDDDDEYRPGRLGLGSRLKTSHRRRSAIV
ncbi:hypothetical protein FN846DRAFT_970749 [Sphaerosporella brunnea]|uniref:Shugoshin n=1 Tax=Sphaerosporella brunnea TaxID=1250544 RepID=A0A5J5EJH8_9PEZI|nr:hypothetical protein FN846DRAFT_970749 [Sphaerosporella brunnea]